MFENFPKNKNEQEKSHEEIRANFETKEKDIRKLGIDFLEEIEPKKITNKAANMLLAFSLFTGATSAFASEQKIDKNMPSPEQYSQTKESSINKNKLADFNWENITGKIEISLSASQEDVKNFHAESISHLWETSTKKGVDQRTSDFYRGVTAHDVYEYSASQYNAIYRSHNAKDFFNNLPTSQKGGFSEKQKVMILQDIGYELGQTYNYDMLNKGETVVVSDDKIFESLRNQVVSRKTIPSGMCGNIHTFLTKTASSLEIESWLQNGRVRGENGGTSNHIFTGIAIGEGDQKQIAFLDYGTLVPTGTLNYRDALGIIERYHNSVSLLENFIGNTTDVLFPVKSRAQEVIDKSSAFEDSSKRLGRNLEHGNIKKEGRRLEINISPEIKEIEIGSDNIGLAFFQFEDTQNNPYQSLRDLSAWRGKVGMSGEHAKIELGATVLNMNVKDFTENISSTKEIISSLTADYVDKKQFNKEQYGEFILSWGTTFNTAISKRIKSEEEDSSGQYRTEATLGGRLTYLDPTYTEKIFIEALSTSHRVIGEYQNQQLNTTRDGGVFAVGGSVKVFEGKVVSAEITESNLDWGNETNLDVGLEGKKMGGTISYNKKSSDYERFVPSSKKIEAGITYKGGHQWEVDVIGAKTTEQYKDAQVKDSISAEVKLKIFLW